MVLFGGFDDQGRYDVWVLESANGTGGVPTWTPLAPAGTIPAPHAGHGAVYSESSDRMVVFGGFPNDVWILENATNLGGAPSWTKLLPTGPAPSGTRVAGFSEASNRMVGLGGGASNRTWVLTNATGLGGVPSWIRYEPSGGPPQDLTGFTAAYDPTADRITVFGGQNMTAMYNAAWILTNATGLGGTPSWIPLVPSGPGPSPRSFHSAVYDPKSNRMVVYGGANETTYSDVWVLSNANGLGGPSVWAQHPPRGESPPMRSIHTAVLDAANNRMTVFAGRPRDGYDLNDTWVLTDATGAAGTSAWIQLNPSGSSPPRRNGHTSVYDPTNNRMIVSGGCDAGTGACLKLMNDVWVLAGANGLGGTPSWTQLFPSGTPPKERFLHAAAYDPTSNRMLVFGGCVWSPCDTRDNEVWMLTYANGIGGTPSWSRVATSGVPPSPRSEVGVVYDSGRDRMVILGGDDGTAKNDVWLLENATGRGGTPGWSQLVASGAPPPPRMGLSAVYDPTRNRMVVFGGYDEFPVILKNDVWVLSNANGLGGAPSWSQSKPIGAPPSRRALHTAVYDATTDKMVVFAGSDGAAENDVWVLDDASNVGPKPPSAPHGLVATPGIMKIELNWSPPQSDGGLPVDYYLLYSATAPNPQAVLARVYGTNFTHSGLPNMMTNYYRVSAVNAIGEGPRSNETSAAPKAGTVPTVTSSPADAETDVTLDTNIVLTFSVPMDKASTSKAFSIQPSVLGGLSWSGGDTVLSFNPDADLQANTEYLLMVAATAQSQEGIALPQAFSAEFITEVGEAPTVTMSPPDGAKDVPLDAEIVLTFSQPMDPMSTSDAISIAPSVTLDLTWKENGTVLEGKPRGGLAVGTKYTVKVGTLAQTMSGVHLKTGFVASFWTAGIADGEASTPFLIGGLAIAILAALGITVLIILKRRRGRQTPVPAVYGPRPVSTAPGHPSPASAPGWFPGVEMNENGRQFPPRG